MTIQRMDHVSVVVDDLEAAVAFFVALGMELEGEAPIEGPWVDRVNALVGVRVDIAMMRTPNGHGRGSSSRWPSSSVDDPSCSTCDHQNWTRPQWPYPDCQEIGAKINH